MNTFPIVSCTKSTLKILIKLKTLKKLLILPNTHKCSESLSNFIGITKKPDRSVSVYINFRFWFLVLCHSSAWDKWMKTISMNLRFLFNKVLFLNFWHLMRKHSCEACIHLYTKGLWRGAKPSEDLQTVINQPQII